MSVQIELDTNMVVLKFPEGRYEGDVNGDGDPEGQGLLEFRGNDEHERMIYEGGFKAKKAHGKGLMKWREGDRYDGDWQDGLRHGQGTYFSKVCDDLGAQLETLDHDDGIADRLLVASTRASTKTTSRTAKASTPTPTAMSTREAGRMARSMALVSTTTKEMVECEYLGLQIVLALLNRLASSCQVRGRVGEWPQAGQGQVHLWQRRCL